MTLPIKYRRSPNTSSDRAHLEIIVKTHQGTVIIWEKKCLKRQKAPPRDYLHGFPIEKLNWKSKACTLFRLKVTKIKNVWLRRICGNKQFPEAGCCFYGGKGGKSKYCTSLLSYVSLKNKEFTLDSRSGLKWIFDLHLCWQFLPTKNKIGTGSSKR